MEIYLYKLEFSPCALRDLGRTTKARQTGKQLFLGRVIWSGRITNSTSRRSWNVIFDPLLVSVELLPNSSHRIF